MKKKKNYIKIYYIIIMLLFINKYTLFEIFGIVKVNLSFENFELQK